MTQVASSFESVKAALKNFAQIQARYRSFGAEDTEPRNIFANIVEKLVEDGDELEIPTTGDGWELYASSMNCDEAAKALHAAATEVVRLVNDCPMRDMQKVRKHINNYWGR